MELKREAGTLGALLDEESDPDLATEIDVFWLIESEPVRPREPPDGAHDLRGRGLPPHPSMGNYRPEKELSLMGPRHGRLEELGLEHPLEVRLSDPDHGVGRPVVGQDVALEGREGQWEH